MEDKNESKFEPEYSPVLLGKVGLSPHDEEANALFPTLMQVLLPRYNRKKQLTREAGSISVRVDGSLFRCTIYAPTDGVQTTYDTDTLVNLLEQLEEHVSNPKTSWSLTYDKKRKAGHALKKLLES